MSLDWKTRQHLNRNSNAKTDTSLNRKTVQNSNLNFKAVVKVVNVFE